MSSKALFSQENPGAVRYPIWVEKVPHPFYRRRDINLDTSPAEYRGMMNLPIGYPYRVNFSFHEKIPTFLCPLT